MNDTFRAVDAYIDALFAAEDAALTGAKAAARAAGLPDIAVTPNQGKLLYLYAKLIGAQRILELGTLGGYSTIWLARALPPDGMLVSLEYDPRYADIARASLAAAGVAARCEVITGAALDTLPALHARGEPPFDLVFLDADKGNYPAYLDWSLRLLRRGGLILADNVVRAGAVLAPNGDASAEGAAAFNAKLAADPRCESVVTQQIGAKGHDGMAIARVL